MSKSSYSKTKRTKQTNLSSFAGQWVVFVNNKVVAHDDTLQRVMEKVEKQGLKAKASAFKVPRKDEGPFVLVMGV